MKVKLIMATFLMAVGVLIACGGTDSQQSSKMPPPASNDSVAAPVETSDYVAPTSTLAVTAAGELAADELGNLAVSSLGDTLKYNSDVISLPKNADINVIFKNESVGLEHNWVVVDASDKDAVLADAIAAGPDNEWIKPSDPRVLAYTKLVKPGETDSLTMTTPASGNLVVICTFPGHAAGGMVSEITLK